MKKIYRFIKTIWKILDGNKTIIGLILLNISYISFVKDFFGNATPIIRNIIQIITGISGIHHIKKGKLSTKER